MTVFDNLFALYIMRCLSDSCYIFTMRSDWEVGQCLRDLIGGHMNQCQDDYDKPGLQPSVQSENRWCKHYLHLTKYTP